MKLKIFFFFAVLLLLTATGCSDFLDRNNPTATTDEKWWNLETDLNGALETVYFGIPAGALHQQTGNVFANSRMHLSATTDESVFRANYSDWHVFPLGQATSETGGVRQLYEFRYLSIRNACRFLENYQKAYVEDPALKARYAAEARALRAWYHMDLFMYFGPVTIVDKSLTPSEQFVARNTQDEVVKFVISELDKAAVDLPVKYPDNDAYRISKGTCFSMQSILYLYIGDYKNAAITAKKVIDSNTYDLHTTTDASGSYASLFLYSGSINKERILFRRAGQTGVFFRNAPKSFGGQATTSPTAAIVNLYETKQGKTIQELGSDSMAIYEKNPVFKNNRDPRLTASVLLPDETYIGRKMDPFSQNSPDLVGQVQSTQTGFWIKKNLDARDVSAPGSGTQNFTVIRYAEILLNYVEALIESGEWQNPDVVLFLNKIRSRAGIAAVDTVKYNSQAKMRELLRRERQVELAFEGQHFFDIRRWKIGEQVLNGLVYGAVNPGTGKPIVVEERKFNPAKDYLWPIPLAEMNVNPNMKQNPNW